MISTRDPYDGVVLRTLVKYGEPSRIEDLRDKAGHFYVDCSDRQAFLLVKYSSYDRSPWQFTFQPGDIETLVADHNRGGLFGGSYVCLVCSFESLCVLRGEEWSALLSLDEPQKQQTITAQRRPGTSFQVTGSAGQLSRAVPVSRFPSLLFE